MTHLHRGCHNAGPYAALRPTQIVPGSHFDLSMLGNMALADDSECGFCTYLVLEGYVLLL